MRFAAVLNWRWTPAFALVGASLVFVLFAIVVVPDQLGPLPGERGGRGSSSGQGLFGKPPASASPFAPGEHASSEHEEPGERVAKPVSNATERARERRAQLRERRPHAPGGGGPSYLDTPAFRMFNRQTSQPSEIPPPEPPAAPAPVETPPSAPEPPAAPAPAEPTSPAPAEAAPAEAPAPPPSPT